MTNSESYSTAAPELPQLPQRRGWPISLWIIPDLLMGFALTIIASLVILGISLGIRLATGDAVWVDGTLRLADGTLLFGPTGSSEGVQGALLTPGFFFWSILAQNLAFAGIVLLRVRVLRRLPWEWLGLQARQFGKLVLIGVGLGVAFLALNLVTSLIFSELLGIRQNQAEQFPVKAGDVVGQALLFLAATVLAPLGEELLFRGYVFHGIKQDLGVIAGLVASAALFSAVHIFGVTQGAPALLVPLFFGGLLLAWAVQWTGSLVPSIIAHAMNNGLAMSVLITCTNNPAACPPQ